MTILSKLDIIGNINGETPLCVILEIADSFGIVSDPTLLDSPEHVSNIILTIEKIKPIKLLKINNNYSKEQIRDIARFVNRDVTWIKDNLLIAFNHFMSYSNCKEPIIPTGNWNYGLKTVEFPLSYDACMLYRICKYYSILTSRKTIIDDMVYSIKLLSINHEDLADNCKKMIEQMPKNLLISLLSSNEYKISQTPSIRSFNNCSSVCYINNSIETIDPNKLDISLINESYNILNDHNIITRVIPNNQYEAIVMAAMIYGINITECINPNIEYEAMQKQSLNSSTFNHYIPIDINFKERFIQNPDFYNIRKNFVEKLLCLYTQDQIIKFVKFEGYTNRNFNQNSYINLLSESRIIPTFHIGWHPDAINKTTTITLENLKDINKNNIITYGIYNEGPLIAYDVRELTEYFKTNKKFLDPHNMKEKYSMFAIDKLKNICKSYNRSNLINSIILNNNENSIGRFVNTLISLNRFQNTQSRVYENDREVNEFSINYKNLLEAIEMVEQIDIASSMYAKKLYNVYIELDNNTKLQFQNILNLLLEIGYYMRGWKIINNNLPLKSEETVYPSNRQIDVVNNVIESIKKYENSILKLNNKYHRELFEFLPLMIKVNDSQGVKYIPSNEFEGITVLNRIKIVKDDKSDYACIRLTSTRFLSTGYYFSIALNLPVPFDIRNMANIS